MNERLTQQLGTPSGSKKRKPDPLEETGGVTGALGNELSKSVKQNIFGPTIYMKKACPFCFKLRLALLEANLLPGVELKEFEEGSAEMAAFKEQHSRTKRRVSFPIAEVEKERFLQGADELIDHFLRPNNINPHSLPTLQAYIHGPFAQLTKS
ncbi:hypothetical protein [Brucella cytisi]|uniref:hypothetical protein n=1 Tax=Brucella cytisi TaxID=407152 RepID=UPI00313E89FF